MAYVRFDMYILIIFVGGGATGNDIKEVWMYLKVRSRLLEGWPLESLTMRRDYEMDQIV
jgi:hypothetical protein